jgi:peptidoglycan L-alanyl-D-glutamate endopeptidase CwlK
MRDKISIQRVAQIHPAIRDKVTSAIDKAEEALGSYAQIRVVEWFRTIAYQNELFAQGRTEPGKIVTWAKGGKSWHNYGLAVDCAIMYDKDKNGTFEFLSWDEIADADHDGEADWNEMVKAFKSEGFEWGGDWSDHRKDMPHFEMRFGMPENCSTAYQKYLNKDFIPGTEFINV